MNLLALALALIISSTTASSSSSSQKTQWAPTGACAPLHARAVFSRETRGAARPCAGEQPASAAGEKDFSYASNNPLLNVDPDGRNPFSAQRRYASLLKRYGWSDAPTELSVASSIRDQIDQAQAELAWMSDDSGRVALRSRIMSLDREASQLENKWETDTDREQSVIRPVAAPVAAGVAAAPVLAAAATTTAGALLLDTVMAVGTGASSAKLTTVATGTKLDGTTYRECGGSWYECDRVWDGVGATSSLVLGFYSAAAQTIAAGKSLFSSVAQRIAARASAALDRYVENPLIRVSAAGSNGSNIQFNIQFGTLRPGAGTPRLVLPIRPLDLGRYGDFRLQPGDELEGHELLQNAWLRQSRIAPKAGLPHPFADNPAVALPRDFHEVVSGFQDADGLFDPSVLMRQSASENIARNAQILRSLGIPESVVEQLTQFATQHGRRLGVIP